MGIASCDKGLPAMMMALAGMRDKPSIIVPGGSTLAPKNGEDAGKIQSIGARFAQGEITLDYAQDMGCKACASPGGGCQFLGTAGTSQVIAESFGMYSKWNPCLEKQCKEICNGTDEFRREKNINTRHFDR